MWWWSSKSKNSESEAEHEETDSHVEGGHPTANALLELQRSSGNQAVQQLISSQAETKDSSGVRIHTDDSAAKSADSLGAAAYTKGRDIYFGAGKYAPQTSEGERLLKHELFHAVQNEPAPESSRGVPTDNFAPEHDSGERDAESFSQSRLDVNSFRSSAPKSSPALVHRAPLTDAEIAQKLHDAMAGLATDEAAILNLLSPLNRDAAKLKKVRDAYKIAFKTDLEADIRLELGGDDLAHALFLLNAPPPATPVTTVKVDAAGPETHKAKVGDGEVSVHKDVSYTPVAAGSAQRTLGFSVGYSGGKASETRWLQFLWSEILATQPDKSVKAIAASGLPVAVGTMDLTTNKSAPNYKVDSGTSDSPFYESAFQNVRTSTGTTIYDRPYEFDDVIKKQFDAGATKVVEIDHFDDFLIREYKTIYRVSVTVMWEYTSKTSVIRSNPSQSGVAVSAMPSDFKKQLVKEYPKFDYIQ